MESKRHHTNTRWCCWLKTGCTLGSRWHQLWLKSLLWTVHIQEVEKEDSVFVNWLKRTHSEACSLEKTHWINTARTWTINFRELRKNASNLVIWGHCSPRDDLIYSSSQTFKFVNTEVWMRHRKLEYETSLAIRCRYLLNIYLLNNHSIPNVEPSNLLH